MGPAVLGAPVLGTGVVGFGKGRAGRLDDPPRARPGLGGARRPARGPARRSAGRLRRPAGGGTPPAAPRRRGLTPAPPPPPPRRCRNRTPYGGSRRLARCPRRLPGHGPDVTGTSP